MNEPSASSRGGRSTVVFVVALLCGPAVACGQGRIDFRDVTEKTGVSFKHTDGSSGKRYIVETVSAGLALFDYDGDEDTDLYFLNGAPLRGTKPSTSPRNVLYRNESNWRFTDVTRAAGVGDTGFGLGVTVGDYDNDGDRDLFLNNYGPNVLYRNNGDGTFTDVTRKAGVGGGERVGAGACFLDMDADGDLDLFVANYVEFTYERHVTRSVRGFSKYAGPRDYPPAPDLLYRNDGDGTFTDVTRESGIGAYVGTGMGMVCLDYDDDGDTDIFVANDLLGNFLFENDGRGNFEEVALRAGVAYDLAGNEQSSMGVACGDYDNDGRLDLHVTSYQRELSTLYRNLGDGVFEDATLTSGAGASSFRHVTWGNGFVDFDNDGDRDLFVACGHLDDNVEQFDDTTSYLAPNILLVNTGDGKFADRSSESGDGLKVELSSRGAAFDDLDNDGDVDAVILNSRREATILRNDSAPAGHWIQVRLEGDRSNHDGVGARVKVEAGPLTLVDEVHSGCGYQSHYGLRLHFGLGPRTRVDRLEVRWIGGGLDVLENVEVDRLVRIREGSARRGK